MFVCVSVCLSVYVCVSMCVCINHKYIRGVKQPTGLYVCLCLCLSLCVYQSYVYTGSEAANGSGAGALRGNGTYRDAQEHGPPLRWTPRPLYPGAGFFFYFLDFFLSFFSVSAGRLCLSILEQVFPPPPFFFLRGNCTHRDAQEYFVVSPPAASRPLYPGAGFFLILFFSFLNPFFVSPPTASASLSQS